jgi:hypothetical protein
MIANLLDEPEAAKIRAMISSILISTASASEPEAERRLSP